MQCCINKAGKAVAPKAEAFQAAASSADWKSAPGYYLILTDQPGDDELAHHGRELHSDPCDSRRTRPLRMKPSSSSTGRTRTARAMAAELDYVPLPKALIDQVRATWKAQIKGVTVAQN